MLIRTLRLAARALPVMAVLFFCCLRAAADGTIDFTRLAPAKPAFVLTITDCSKLHAAFEGSELGKLWDEPGVQAFVQEMTSDASKRAGEFFKELGADSKDLKPPTGGAGIAIYIPESTPGKPPERGHAPPPMALFAADAGENAQSWKDLIDKLIDKGTRDKQFTTDEDTYAGAKITILKPIYQETKDKPDPEPKKPDDGGDEEDDGPLVPPQTGFAGFIGGSKDHPQALHLAWSGTTLLAATRAKDLEFAIDAVQGKDADSLASDPDFKAAAAQHPAEVQAAIYVNFAQLFSEALGKAIGAQSGLDDGASAPDFEKMMSALGLDKVKCVSMGLRLDTAEGLVDMSLGVLAPEKKGLLSLINQPLGAFDPPAFVPPDAAGISRFSFQFDKLYDLLRQVVQALPEEERQQASSGLDQGVNLVKPGLDALGPTVSMVETFKQPLAHDSQMTLVVIDVKDQSVVSNTLSFFAGQAQGMAESREFEGNTIYTVEMAGVSVGLGFNRLFVGPTAAVENAMRLSGRADAPKIGSEAAFKEATRGMGQDGVMQSYSDMAQTLRWQYWSIQNADKIIEAQIDEAGLEPDQKERILKRIRENRPKWLEKLPPLESLLKHLGDSATELHPTPDGFRGRALLLRPAPK